MALIGSGSMTNLHNLLYVSVNSCVFEHSLSFRKRKVAVIFFIVKLLMELDPSAAFTESHQRLSVSAECLQTVFLHTRARKQFHSRSYRSKSQQHRTAGS